MKSRPKNKKRFVIGRGEIDYQWGNAYGKNRAKCMIMAGRADFEKKSWRKCKNVTCRGVFEQQKRKPIFGVFKLHFLKTLVFHRYIRPITCQHSILRCDFF